MTARVVEDTDTEPAAAEPNWTAWLEARHTELSGFVPAPDDTLDERIDRGSSLLAFLDRAGVTGWGWPTALGGRGGTAVQRANFYDALTRCGLGLPESVAALEVVGSALVEFAPRLAAQHLPDILAGRSLWCQGFSEPDAGSDLASLRTTARPVDGGWVINGQKVWTSLAHRADWCAVLARTGDKDSRHRGLTMFWVDLRAAGVSVRPLRTLTGEEEFSEVYLDDVTVAEDRVIGEVGGGWAVAMHLLQFERGMWAWQRQALMHAELERALAAVGELSATQAQEVGRAYAGLAALRVKCRRTVERLAAGEVLGPEVSVDKVLLSQTEHAVNDVIRSLDRLSFSLTDDAAARGVRAEWFYSRAASVYGGAVEVQKNIIAQRLLHLPRGVRNG
ncbi:acyl-CoA dehydrogenase family protein [Nocardia sp. NPDC050378]|uniref:acyl-CoA dehydrogenase family protein n=1 Tax=Nocardia sp. NPDC050378 TaxID=3155400 RepID=UPI00340EFD9F